MEHKQLIEALTTQSLELQKQIVDVFAKQITVNELDEQFTVAKRTAEATVQELADNALDKKEYSNEAKRQKKVREILETDHKPLITNLDMQREVLAQLQCGLELARIKFSTTKTIARLVSSE